MLRHRFGIFWRQRPARVIGFGDLWGPSGTSGDHLGTIWEMDSMKLSVSLLLRRLRSARIDPSRFPSTAGARIKKSYRRTKNIKKESETIKNVHT